MGQQKANALEDVEIRDAYENVMTMIAGEVFKPVIDVDFDTVARVIAFHIDTDAVDVTILVEESR